MSEPVRMNGHVVVEEIEPGSREDLFNRADPGCELCEGTGHVGPAPCPCTEVDPA